MSGGEETNTTANQQPGAVPPPDQTSRASDFLLGAFTILAACGYIGTWLWLKAEPLWAPAQHVNVLFHNVAGLNENAAVFTDGVRIGAVEKIHLLGQHKVEVQMRINESMVRLPEGSTFAIRTNGLVGARYVDVTLPANGGKEMTSQTVAWGTDPVRQELIMDHVALALQDMDFKRMESDFNVGMERMASAADDVTVLSHKLNPVAEKAAVLEDKVALLTGELHGTSARVNRLLKDPQLASNMRETLVKLNEMTAHVETAATKVEAIANDQNMRADIKQVVGDARETVHEVHEMVNNPQFGSEMKSTMTEAHEAMARLDMVGRQLNQILSKRAPLLQMFVGRPGKLKEEQQSAGLSESTPQ